MKTFLELYDELKEKSKGVYYYMNLRKKKGISRPKGHPKAPSKKDLERASKTAKGEGVQEDGHTQLDKTNARQKRELERLALRHDRQDDRARRRDTAKKNIETRPKLSTEKAPDTSDAMKRYKSGKAGFTDIAHLKAKGLIKRSDGTKRKSDKYK